jgi:hypothetical protein
MASFNKIQGWVGYLGLGAINLNTDTLECYLTNATPSASADDVKADLAEIAIENGYTGGVDTQNAYSEASGTGTLTATDITITATGSVGPFRYVALFDETVSSPVTDPLAGWWDYASELTLANGESFTIDFGASLATLV